MNESPSEAGERSGVIRWFCRAMKVVFIVLSVFLVLVLLFLLSLFFHEQVLPDSCVVALTERISSTNVLVTCERASFGFRQGLRLRNVRVHDLEKTDSVRPFAHAGELALDWFARQVTVTDLKCPRLPDSYYLPREKKDPYVNWMAGVRLREVERFQVKLVRPEVFGIVASQVELSVKVAERSVAVEDIRLNWPDRSGRMSLAGSTILDFDGSAVRGQVHGLATQAQIRPLLVVLDVDQALPYMDEFTEVAEPVEASCAWDVDARTCGFRLELGLHPKQGKYRGMVMNRVDGTLTLDILPNPTNFIWNIKVGPLVASDAADHQMNGTVGIYGTNDACRIRMNVDSRLPLKEALAVSHVLDGGVLDCLECETPPHITAEGVFSPFEAEQSANDICGTVAFVRGKFFGAPVGNVSARYSCRGDTVTITNVTACGRMGGAFSGWAELSIPGYDEEKSSFRLTAQVRDGAIAELADVFRFDPRERYGRVNAQFALAGGMGTNRWTTLNGEGRLKITDGQLNRLKLFAGLTDLMASKVPGIASIVNQSEATCTFTITNGVLKSEDIYVEGGLFSIKAYGSYDISADNLDFMLRVQLLRNDSLLGRLVHPVTWVFSKLLLEYHVTGSAHEPKWEYITIPERIVPR